MGGCALLLLFVVAYKIWYIEESWKTLEFQESLDIVV